MSVKKFRGLLRRGKGKELFEVDSIVPCNNLTSNNVEGILKPKEELLEKLISKYKTVFRGDVPPDCHQGGKLTTLSK